MQNHELHYLPLQPPVIKAISEILRERALFVPSFVPSVDIYDVFTYRREALHLDTKTHLLADRNLVTRWLSLLGGSLPSPEHRTAAAVMAFAQCADIAVEPNIAFYEVAVNIGNAKANEELRAFRVADNLDPEYWAGVALGGSSTLVPIDGTRPPPTIGVEMDFEMPLRRWRSQYVTTLKIAELELRGGESASRMSELLRWMYEDYLFSGPAVMLACHYLAPNSNRKRLLKNLRSADRERAIAGVKNATWDLTLLSQWKAAIDTQVERNTLTLLCSLDEKVLSFAKALVELMPTPNQLENTFKSLWGAKEGERLSSQLHFYTETAEDPARQLVKLQGQFDFDELIRKGERVLRSWPQAV